MKKIAEIKQEIKNLKESLSGMEHGQSTEYVELSYQLEALEWVLKD